MADVESWVVSAARVTVGFLLVYLGAIINQSSTRRTTLSRHEASKKSDSKEEASKFNRYAPTDLQLIVADRIVGNLLEWSFVFLSTFWLAAKFSNGSSNVINGGWIYVAARLVYVILGAMGYTFGYKGPKPVIFFITTPGYLCLIYFMYTIWQHVF